MNEQLNKQNAKIALRQIRMEIVADYGMSYEDAFDIIESAQNNNLISSYFNNFQNQNSIYQLNNHQ